MEIYDTITASGYVSNDVPPPCGGDGRLYHFTALYNTKFLYTQFAGAGLPPVRVADEKSNSKELSGCKLYPKCAKSAKKSDCCV